MPSSQESQADWEYIVVGSGAGGGTVAARLAEKGRRVLLLEAGGDPRDLRGGDPIAPTENRLPHDYDVPAFHAFATENDAIKWDFFVRHYADDRLQRADPKYREEWNGRRVDGVLYPRAGTLGGCTAHNAMIVIYPHNEDWDHIAQLTGDPSWSAKRMRAHFQQLEDCQHRRPYRWLSKIGINPTLHGWKGWLQTEKALPLSALRDEQLLTVIFDCAHEAFEEIGRPIDRIASLLESQFDPNDWRTVKRGTEGIWYTPLSTNNHARVGTRERLLKIQDKCPNHLKIELNALATRVLLDGRRAVGVEYLRGERLYRAHGSPGEHAERREVRASREVILAGGAFNTPQLLMLSGIGPKDVLRRNKIEVKVDLPGVGKNLQDRYEIGVVNRMNFDEWRVFEGAKFSVGDSLYRKWANEREDVYTTNGTVLTVLKKSTKDRPLPDLFFLAVLGRFEGYVPKYSETFARDRDYLTWVVLKAHTNNRKGEVTLRSPDPRDTPCVNFHYFEEGTDDGGEDLDSVVDGIKFVRKMTRKLKEQKIIAEETLPGEHRQSDDELKDFIRKHAWGHHASCTCAIGPESLGGVLGSDFRVHGVQNLRVVDASVFPRIPGFFIVSAVYMIGEKAASVILADAEVAAPPQ